MKRYRKNARACLESLEIQLNVIGYPEADSCKELMRHARKLKNLEMEGMAHYYSALFYRHLGQQKQGMSYLTEAIKCLEATECYEKITDVYNALGTMAHELNNLVLAIESYNSALDYCRNFGLEYQRFSVESNMAGVYYRMGAYETAAGYYEKTVQEYRRIKDESQRNEWNYMLILSAYGKCLLAMKNYERAKKIEAEIWEMLYYHPAMAVPKLAVYTFFAVIHKYGKEEDKASEYAEVALADLTSTQGNSLRHDNILDLLQYLVKAQQLEKLKKVLEYLEGREAVQTNEGFLLQLLLIRLQYCDKIMNKEEYRYYSAMFFRLRENYEKEEYRQIMQTVELRNKLKIMRKEQQEITMQNEKLLQKSLHDEVSGLPNRRYLNKKAEEMLQEAEKYRNTFCVVLVDIDFFKEYNDEYGHHAGDGCIRAVADILARTVSETGFAARYGGDEFVLLFADKNPEEMTVILTHVKEDIAGLQLLHEKAKEGIVTVSQGCVSDIPGEESRVWDFMSAADRALYLAKQKGRNRYYVI